MFFILALTAHLHLTKEKAPLHLKPNDSALYWQVMQPWWRAHVRDNTWQVVRPMIVMDDVGAKEPGGLPERFGPDPHKYETHF